MSHSFNKIWVHAIWATKEREPIIHSNIEEEVHSFIFKQFVELGCYVQAINGMPDHVHCLFLLSPKMAISEVIKQIKGSSSHFINDQQLIEGVFAWQTGYAAYSVSESVLEKVEMYIRNQKKHHAQSTFQEEFDEFIKLNKIKR